MTSDTFARLVSSLFDGLVTVDPHLHRRSALSELYTIPAAAVQAALKDFAAEHGGQLRLLFNCAGVLRFGHFESIELAEHARILQINVLGLLQMIHAAFPYLKATANAQVINMGSASGLYGTPHMASYSASKFAVRGLTEALAMAREAEARGLKLMVGCMLSTSLGISPAFLVAQGALWVDLDGPILLAEDREDGFRFEKGMILPA